MCNESDSADHDIWLKLLPGAKSQVRRYFVFSTNEKGTILDRKHVSCTVFKKSMQFSGNTASLSYHLQHNHPEQFDEISSKTKKGAQKSLQARQTV